MEEIRNAGLHTIKSENHGDTSMNKEKEKFLKFINFYKNVSCNIGETLYVLDYICKPEKYSVLSTVAKSFTNTVISNFYAQVVIYLHEFYYNLNDYSFIKFFNYIISNWDKIFTGDFHIYYNNDKEHNENKKYTYNDIGIRKTACEKFVKFISENIDIEVTIEEYKKVMLLTESNNFLNGKKGLNSINLKDIPECVEIREIIKNLRTLRDNCYAHHGELKQEIIVTIKQLKKIFLVTENIINQIYTMYDGSNICSEPLGKSGINILCDILSDYIEFKDDIIGMKYRKRMEKLTSNLGK